MSARKVLRDLRTERGETPADGPEELAEAARIQRDGSTEPDATARALASEVVDEAGVGAMLRATFFRRRE